MASDLPSVSHGDLSENEAIYSSFHKTVCLDDWWLIETEKDFRGKRLAVGGMTSRERQAIRAFSSSPIVKKYDVCTLETADGITVLLNGLINREVTLQNGFPSEVCKIFLFGFPPDWETYSGECVPLTLRSLVYGEGDYDVRNSGEISNAGNCNCEAIKDEGPSLLISSNVKNFCPLKVNVFEKFDTSTNFPAVSSRKRKFKDEDGLKGKGEVSTVYPVEEALSVGNISGLDRGGLKGTAEESLLTTPNSVVPKFSEKDIDLTVIIGLKANASSPSVVKQNKFLDRRVNDRLKNLKANQKSNSGSTLCVTNEDNKPNSMLETFDNPTGEKLAGKTESKKIPYGGKTDSKGIHCHSGTRQSRYGLRSLKSTLSEEQATGCSHETETNEVDPVSVDSLLVNDIAKEIGHKSKKGKSALDHLPDVGLKEMTAKEVDNMSSLSSDSFKKPE